MHMSVSKSPAGRRATLTYACAIDGQHVQQQQQLAGVQGQAAAQRPAAAERLATGHSLYPAIPAWAGRAGVP